METPASAEAVPVRTAAAGRGVDWIAEAFGLFRQAPGTWIGILLVWIVVSAALGAISAELLSTFLNPVFQAGLMLGCVSLSRGEGLRVEHLFAAFRSDRLGSLLMMALIQIGLAVALGIVLVLLVLAVVQGTWGGLPPDWRALDVEQLAPGHAMALALLVLLVVALVIPLAMLVWFAPALIVLRRLDAWTAMKLSLRGCLLNWLPLLLYGLVALLVLVVAALPLLLGLLVALPVLVASVYTSYRDIYPEPGAPA